MCDASTSSSPSADSASDSGEGRPRSRVGIVGVCGAGKTSLASALCELGYEARQISQEHSYVHDLWRRFWTPNVLVYLDASDATVDRRLGSSSFPRLLERQRRRLRHAREHSAVYVRTDSMTKAQVLASVLQEISSPVQGSDEAEAAAPRPPARD